MAFRGGRGGGRGGGPGRGGAMAGPLGSATAFLDYAKVDKTPSKMFPDTGRIPRLDPATADEKIYVAAQVEYLNQQKHSPYWPVEVEKKAKELPRYSDRYRQEEQEQPSLDKNQMQQEVFPPALWKAFFEGEEKRAAKAAKRKELLKAKSSNNVDWDKFEKAGDGDDGDDADADDAALAEEEVGDYDEEEEDDYNENYFDNGEDDDIEDLGGGGGGGDDYD